MLKLVKIEFYKLRRKKFIWLMLLSAFVMPFFAFLYFGYLGQTDIAPAIFYKWSAFGFTLFIILPFILGLFGTMLMHDENRYDMLKQTLDCSSKQNGIFFQQVLRRANLFYLLYAYKCICFRIIQRNS